MDIQNMSSEEVKKYKDQGDIFQYDAYEPYLVEMDEDEYEEFRRQNPYIGTSLRRGGMERGRGWVPPSFPRI